MKDKADKEKEAQKPKPPPPKKKADESPVKPTPVVR